MDPQKMMSGSRQCLFKNRQSWNIMHSCLFKILDISSWRLITLDPFEQIQTYGCLRYGFWGWGIHFCGQIGEILQSWWYLNFCQSWTMKSWLNIGNLKIWWKKWNHHPWKPYHRHPYLRVSDTFENFGPPGDQPMDHQKMMSGSRQCLFKNRQS